MAIINLILKLEGNRIYYRTDKYVNFENSTLASIYGYDVGINKTIYLETEFDLDKDYERRTRALKVKIIDYNSNKSNNFLDSKSGSNLAHITFLGFDRKK